MKTSDLKKLCKMAKEMGLKRLKTADFEIELFESTPRMVGGLDPLPKTYPLPVSPVIGPGWPTPTGPTIFSTNSTLPAGSVQMSEHSLQGLMPTKEDISDEDLLFWSSPVQFDDSPGDAPMAPGEP